MRLCGTIVLLLAVAAVGLAEHRPVKIIIADAVFPVFDPDAKDVFVFTGPLPVDPPATTAPAKLASLTPSCADCHKAGSKVRGEFELFGKDGKINNLAKEKWREVLNRITRPVGKDGRMPPPDANKPAVSAADVAEIRRLAGG